MAQFTSYASGGKFDPVTITDDSERILRQSEDLLKQQRLLSEYNSKQAATLANNVNREFQRSKAIRDENYRRRKEQVEINYRIKEAEGRDALQAAQGQAKLNDAFKKQQDAKKMQAFADLIEAGSKIGAAVVEDQVGKAEEAAKAQAAENILNPTLGADPVPAAETVGQVVQDGVETTAQVAANEQDQFAETSRTDRFDNPLQRMFGINAAYEKALKLESFKLEGTMGFTNFAAQARRDGNLPVTVTLQGVQQDLTFGDPQIDRDPVALQEALTQVKKAHADSLGLGDVDPVAAGAYHEGVNAYMTDAINRSMLALKGDNIDKAIGTAKAKFNAKTYQNPQDLQSLAVELTSIKGVGFAKEQIAKMVQELANTLFLMIGLRGVLGSLVVNLFLKQIFNG